MGLLSSPPLVSLASICRQNGFLTIPFDPPEFSTPISNSWDYIPTSFQTGSPRGAKKEVFCFVFCCFFFVYGAFLFLLFSIISFNFIFAQLKGIHFRNFQKYIFEQLLYYHSTCIVPVPVIQEPSYVSVAPCSLCAGGCRNFE